MSNPERITQRGLAILILRAIQKAAIKASKDLYGPTAYAMGAFADALDSQIDELGTHIKRRNANARRIKTASD